MTKELRGEMKTESVWKGILFISIARRPQLHLESSLREFHWHLMCRLELQWGSCWLLLRCCVHRFMLLLKRIIDSNLMTVLLRHFTEKNFGDRPIVQ